MKKKLSLTLGALVLAALSQACTAGLVQYDDRGASQGTIVGGLVSFFDAAQQGEPIRYAVKLKADENGNWIFAADPYDANGQFSRPGREIAQGQYYVEVHLAFDDGSEYWRLRAYKTWAPITVQYQQYGDKVASLFMFAVHEIDINSPEAQGFPQDVVGDYGEHAFNLARDARLDRNPLKTNLPDPVVPYPCPIQLDKCF